MCHRPNFVPIGQTGAFFDFSRGRPSTSLDLFYACLDHPRNVVDGLYRCAKFGWNRYCIFEDMRFSIFFPLGLKMPIHAPFGDVLWVNVGIIKTFAVLSSRNAITFWGCFEDKRGENKNLCSFILQKCNNHKLASKSLLQFSPGTRAKVVVTKKLKTMRGLYFNHLPRRPHLGDRFEFWRAGSYRRRDHPCQIL